MGKLVPLALLVLATLLISGCQRVNIRGDRVDDGRPVKIAKLYIYSFLNANPGMQLGRYNREIAQFQQDLVRAFHERGVTAKIVDAVQQSGLDGVSAVAPANETYKQYGNVSVHSGVTYLPIKQMLAANKGNEAAFGASHRLILVLAMVSGDTSYSADMSWRMENVSNDSAVAQGTLHFIMDIRGVPSKDMTIALMDELGKLNID
jgi:hypothetical protein